MPNDTTVIAALIENHQQSLLGWLTGPKRGGRSWNASNDVTTADLALVSQRLANDQCTGIIGERAVPFKPSITPQPAAAARTMRHRQTTNSVKPGTPTPRLGDDPSADVTYNSTNVAVNCTGQTFSTVDNLILDVHFSSIPEPTMVELFGADLIGLGTTETSFS